LNEPLLGPFNYLAVPFGTAGKKGIKKLKLFDSKRTLVGVRAAGAFEKIAPAAFFA
jgi:hypothetical protein